MNAQTNTQAIAIVEPRRSLLAEMAGRYGMEPKTFADTLRATVVPKEASNEEFAAFLVVAREYNLNPLTKEIYAFPKRGGGIQPILSIDGWLNIINSHPQLNGIEFDDHLDKDGKVTAITARIWRKDREKAIVVTEYMAECVRSTDTWKGYPRRMLRHKALIQCARYAFGFAGIVDPDEAERIGVLPSKHRTANDDGPPPPPAAIDHDRNTGEVRAEPDNSVVWEETGERPATQDDGIPSFLDRQEGAPAENLLDPEQWRRDMDGALSACSTKESLFKFRSEIIAMKDKVPNAVYQAVVVTYTQTFDRIAMDAG